MQNLKNVDKKDNKKILKRQFLINKVQKLLLISKEKECINFYLEDIEPRSIKLLKIETKGYILIYSFSQVIDYS